MSIIIITTTITIIINTSHELITVKYNEHTY